MLIHSPFLIPSILGGKIKRERITSCRTFSDPIDFQENIFYYKQGRKRLLEKPKRMIEREREKGRRRDIEREGEIRERERE